MRARSLSQINDGHAGGHLMSRNAGFNLVRETTDHGVFNSWDRNTYQAHAWDPTNLETLPIVMDQNLFICNYRAYFPIDSEGERARVRVRPFACDCSRGSTVGRARAHERA